MVVVVDLAVKAYGAGMMWDELFADLEAQMDAAIAQSTEAEIDDLTIAEESAIGWMDRVRSGIGADLSLVLRDGTGVHGTVLDATRQWILLASAPRQVLVPRWAVAAAHGLGRVAPEPGAVERRLGFGHALRALAEGEVAVRVRAWGIETTGTIERVGADHLDVRTAAGSVTSHTMDAVMAVSS